MSIHPDAIRRVGRALYGENFVGPLARDLGVAERSLQRVLSGTREAPAGWARELLALHIAQGENFARMLGLLNGPKKRPAAQGTALAIAETPR